MPVHELRISGYRSIHDLRLRLRRVNVLTGPNGCGKSNLYNSIFLLAKTATGGFARAIAEEGGMPSVLWAGPRRTTSSQPMNRDRVRVRLGVRTDTLSYELVCGLPRKSNSAFDLDPEVKEERVWMEPADTRSRRRVRPVTFFKRDASGTWIRDRDGARTSYSGELLPSESVLAQLREPHLYPELSALRSEMAHWRFYHHFRTDPESPLRRPQVAVRTPVLSHDGSDVAAAVQTIREVGFAEDFDHEVRAAFPGARLIVDCSSAGFTLSMEVPGLNRALSTRELSDGTLRYICLLAALLSPRPPSLLALNEPETSLHPDLLDPLAKLIATAGKNTQLWITTHSSRLAELIGRCTAEEPIRLELVGGETRVVGQRLIESDDDDENDEDESDDDNS